MNSSVEREAVLNGLGSKITTGLQTAVQAASQDLADYRAGHPEWVADASSRGLANWIHDRLWAHMVAEVADVEGIAIHEKGATREIHVVPAGQPTVVYRCRLKRHTGVVGAIRNYWTATALDFASQDRVQLPDFAEITVYLGYEWLTDANEIGDALISLSDGKDNVLWVERFIGGTAAGAAPATLPAQPGPTRPTIEVGEPDEGSGEAAG